MKFAEHIKLLKEVKVRLPMTREETLGFSKSSYICDNLVCTPYSDGYGLRPYGDPVATEVKELIDRKINGEFSLLEYHNYAGPFEGGQQLRQEFLDILILYYENLNEQS